MATTREANQISTYSFNARNGTEQFEARMEHMYITDCQLLGTFEIFYILLGLLYCALIFLWRHQVWIKYPDPLSTSLQRGVISLPILKLL